MSGMSCSITRMLAPSASRRRRMSGPMASASRWAMQLDGSSRSTTEGWWASTHARSTTRSDPFFFTHTTTTEIYTLSLHDALPISRRRAEETDVDLSQIEGTGSDGLITVKDVTSAAGGAAQQAAGTADRAAGQATGAVGQVAAQADRKSTRLNSSH